MYALRARLSDGFEVDLDGEHANEQAAINAADRYITDYSDPCKLGVYVQQVAIIDLQLLTFEGAKDRRDAIEAKGKAASAVLQAFPREGPMGLPTDEVRTSPAYQAAKAAYAAAHRELQHFNTGFTKRFAAELKAERDNRRPAA